MAVGNDSWDCLQTINDSNRNMTGADVFATSAATSNIATSSIDSNLTIANAKNKIENFEPVTSFSNSSQANSETTILSNTTSNNSNTSTNVFSLRKARSGRNHAGAKILASQYTKGKYTECFANS